MTIKRYVGDKFVGLSSDTKPTAVPDGAIFYETDTLSSYIKQSNVWSSLGGGSSGGTSVVVADTAPETPSEGDLWFDSTDGTLNIYYEDLTSNQWVTTSGTAGINGTNGLGFTGGDYNSSTGIVIFSSDDGIGFSTGDLRPSSSAITGRAIAMAMIFG